MTCRFSLPGSLRIVISRSQRLDLGQTQDQRTVAGNPYLASQLDSIYYQFSGATQAVLLLPKALTSMLSHGRTSASQWLRSWLLITGLPLVTHIQLVAAQTAVSTLFVPDTNTIISVNLVPDSEDINFYVSTPDWYQYTAIGFGASMPNALMLVMYASGDRKGVTVSPRIATGNMEPVWSPSVELTLHSSTIDEYSDMVVNGTCHRCRPLIKQIDSASPMMFAVGPSLDLSSDEPDARIRRHIAYGQFTMDLVRATGPGGIGSGFSGNASSGATLAADGLRQDSNKAATAHGILYAIVALAVAPFDSLVAGALGSRWAWLHGVTASVYLAFVFGALVPGVLVSREHVATRQFRTGHQVIGLLTIVAMTLMFVWGLSLSWIKGSAKKRGQEPPESTRLLGVTHRWICRVIWVLLLVNVGL
ncbi:iron reductase domain protein [Parathielavia appendiculata]|uniref:Iron reductase domain protein n=1 Tax=Parathielavia appendiculata TaxID=2587402 RepID=A0AAN6TVW8_9PEZI|nr:iron reductase domain protein [Parathielavia appendiculata]